ncbi:integrase, catalytic region, zinc finger, CCHC-type containing protein [Tanacetum coccineum]
MSTSKTYQQYLANAGSENRPPMLERGPYEFKNFVPEGLTIPQLQTVEDLEDDDLLLHDAKMEVMNMILLSIPNEIYNSVDACTLAKDIFGQMIFFHFLQQFEKLVNASRAKKLEKSHDLLALVANTGSSSRQTSSYYVTHPPSVVDYDDEYQNQAIIQGDMVNIQRRNSGNTGRNNRRAYVQEEVVEGMNAPNETGNVQRTLCTPSSGNTSTMLLAKQDEAGVILTDEHNDFLFIDASRMEEIEELSANICLMARIQPADHTSDDGPSCESAFISEGYKRRKDVLCSTESELDELEKQNDLLKDQLLEASLKHDVELCVLLNHECVDKILSDELDQVKKKSFEIQEGLQSRIKILKKDVQRCQKQSVDFELKLQHEKEKHKWDSTLRNKNTNPLDYSWISKLEKLENENVSLDFKVQSLIKERDNVKIEYQKLFDSIKKTRSQTQKEMDELIVHVSEKTYAYGAIRAENQDLLSTISELKTRLEKVEKGVNTTSRVRRPMSKDSSVTNSVLVNSKKATKNVSVYVRKNKQKNITSANVISNKENVIAVDVTNASKAKTLLCVSYMQNVLIPCHDKCLAKHKLNVRSNVRRTFSTNSRTPKSLETTYVAPKTRFSKKETQSKTLDTTSVVFKSKIDVESASKAKDKVVQIVLWIVDIGCSKHMMGDQSLLRNFIEKIMGIVRFGNDNFAAITGYIAFRSKTCYVRNLEGDDLLTGGRESNLYTISISDMAASSSVCLMSKATSTKSWLWHRRLSHLNFGTINDLTRLDLVDGLSKFKYGKDHLCFAYERGKSKKASHPPKLVPSNHSKLELLHMDLCRPMRVASINGKKYILVIVDDYSRYTWVYFLHLKDETPEIINIFIAQAQLNYKAKVCKICTDNGTEFKNATRKAHYEKLGIMQQFSTARTPQQNGVVERRNRTLVEAARTMLIFSRLPEFLWAEVVATACFTQN